MHQGCSDDFCGPSDDVTLASEDAGIDFDAQMAVVSADLPMGRFSESHEIASMVVFLCAAQSSYVTGAMVSMDGALTPVI